MTSLSEDLQAALAAVDTPTICNAIEVVEGRRGYDRFTRSTVMCSDPEHGPILGRVKTARIRSVEPSAEPAEKTRERRLDYYRYVSEPPRPAVVVIEDADGAETTGAFWGEVNTAVHKGLGLSGVVTNGLMRDLGDLAPGFPLIAAAVGPSHAHVHVVDFDTPVTVFGLDVKPGEFIHADRHGAVIIPDEMLPKLPEAILRSQSVEKIVLGPAREPGFTFERLQAAWAELEKARA